MKIAIVSDAWYPQVNGVVRTLSTTKKHLEALGHSVGVISPDLFYSIPCPTYPEISLALKPAKKLKALLSEFSPEAIHIATEGPLGIAARAYCLQHAYPFTTSFHTRFPEYIKLRLHIPLSITYRFLLWFHRPAQAVLVATESLKKELEQKGLHNLALWSRGVDTNLFKPGDKSFLSDKRPIFLYAGRVAIEKNIEAFLKLYLPGTKYVVGDGPDLVKLKYKYPDVKFVGYKSGTELAQYMAAPDVFVFPSRTDTFGLVMLEALACGVPVAAFPVPGPSDVISQGVSGYLNHELIRAAIDALSLDKNKCREYALNYSWETCTRQFIQHLSIIDSLTHVETLGNISKCIRP